MKQEAQLQKAVQFFSQPAWARLMQALYTKYIEQGQIRGQVILSQATPTEQREIARFLGKALPATAELKVRLSDFQQGLLTSSFACELPALLASLFPERTHVTKAQQKEQHARTQQAFDQQLRALSESLSPDSPGHAWLTQGKHGQDALFRQYKNAAPDTQKHILHILQLIIQALDQLPTAPQVQYLSQFALRISGDPHFLDTNTTSGRLFLTALTDLHFLTNSENRISSDNQEQQANQTSGEEQDHWRHLLYYEFGLLRDAISSTVAVCQLKEAYDTHGQRDTLITYAGTRILILPLRQLLRWQKIVPCSKHVYIFENPQVFEVIVDTLLQKSEEAAKTSPTHLPTLVCTSGWPSVAAIRLLSLFIASDPDTQLYYSGDFDLQGLRIAHSFLTRYPQNCHLWHIDPAAYLHALHRHAELFDIDEIAALQQLPSIFSPLVQSMLHERRKAYHEGIIDLLAENILNNV